MVKYLLRIFKVERENMMRDVLGEELILGLLEGEVLVMKVNLGFF